MVIMAMMVVMIPSVIGILIAEPDAIIQSRPDPNFLSYAIIIMLVDSDPAIIGILIIKPIPVVIAWTAPRFNIAFGNCLNLYARSDHRIDGIKGSQQNK